MGGSRVERDLISVAKGIMAHARRKRVELLLPVDHIIADTFSANARRDVTDGVIPEGWMGLDIGPKTAELYANAVRGARTVFWNGPMGVFEFPAFANGTETVAQAVADCPGYTVVGGGDSVRAIHQSGQAAGVSHISTGGGASLEFMEGRSLPGLAALGYGKTL